MAHPPDPKLRFAVLCDSPRLRAWQWQTLENLRSVPGVEPVAVVVNAGRRPPPSFAERFGRAATNGLFAWSVFDRCVASRPTDATRRIDPPGWFSALPRIDAMVEVGARHSQRFTAHDLERLRALHLDFLIKFGFGILRGPVLEAARYGVWSFHHDDIDRYRGAPPGFWEIVEGDPVTGAVLQRLTERLDGGVVLKRGYWRTIGESYRRNRDQTYRGSAVWPAQVCRDILSGNGGYLDDSPVAVPGRLYRYPRNVDVARASLRLVRNWIGRQLDDLLLSDIWNVGVVEADVQHVAEHGIEGPIRWLERCPGDRYFADPSAITVNGQTWVFAEDFSHRRSRGVIAARRLDAETPGEWRTVIDGTHHLSFPLVFEHESVVYCLPEASASGAVTLLRADPFPHRWVPAATLLPGFPGVDPTLLRHEGRWWLFCTHATEGDCTHLYAFHADDLLGPYRPHGNNPVKIDVRSARPAGPPFRLGGSWVRPSQNDARTYGGSITLNRLVHLDPGRFVEEPIGEIGPKQDGPYSCGMHTIQGLGGVTFVDGKRRAFLPAVFARQLAGKLARLARSRSHGVGPRAAAGESGARQ